MQKLLKKWHVHDRDTSFQSCVLPYHTTHHTTLHTTPCYTTPHHTHHTTRTTPHTPHPITLRTTPHYINPLYYVCIFQCLYYLFHSFVTKDPLYSKLYVSILLYELYQMYNEVLQVLNSIPCMYSMQFHSLMIPHFVIFIYTYITDNRWKASIHSIQGKVWRLIYYVTHWICLSEMGIGSSVNWKRFCACPFGCQRSLTCAAGRLR